MLMVMLSIVLFVVCFGCIGNTRRVNSRSQHGMDSLAEIFFAHYPAIALQPQIVPRSVSRSRQRQAPTASDYVFGEKSAKIRQLELLTQAMMEPPKPSIPSASTWLEIERSLPSLAEAGPIVFNSESEMAQADLKDNIVLFRDRNGWCPYSERVWLALELKNVSYVTCLVDDDYSSQPGSKGSLPRVRWADGSMNNGSDIRAIFDRIEKEHPNPPHFFPEVSASVAVVRNSFDRFDGIMPRFTLPSSTSPYVFACRVQREGSFEVEECEIGELVPTYKYNVCLEEIEEMLQEYDDGPFIAGKTVTAADIYWAPFLERFAAHLPMLSDSLRPRGGRVLGALAEWYDAMDELVPCYSCRVKGRVASWQSLLSKEPYLEGKLQKNVPIVPNLPTKSSFDADEVWKAYADGKPHLASTPSEEAAACIVRNRAHILEATSSCGFADADATLREICDALVSDSTVTKLSLDGEVMALYLYVGCKGFSVPQDLGVIPADVLYRFRSPKRYDPRKRGGRR